MQWSVLSCYAILLWFQISIVQARPTVSQNDTGSETPPIRVKDNVGVFGGHHHDFRTADVFHQAKELTRRQCFLTEYGDSFQEDDFDCSNLLAPTQADILQRMKDTAHGGLMDKDRSPLFYTGYDSDQIKEKWVPGEVMAMARMVLSGYRAPGEENGNGLALEENVFAFDSVIRASWIIMQRTHIFNWMAYIARDEETPPKRRSYYRDESNITASTANTTKSSSIKTQNLPRQLGTDIDDIATLPEDPDNPAYYGNYHTERTPNPDKTFDWCYSEAMAQNAFPDNGEAWLALPFDLENRAWGEDSCWAMVEFPNLTKNPKIHTILSFDPRYSFYDTDCRNDNDVIAQIMLSRPQALWSREDEDEEIEPRWTCPLKT